MEEIFKETLKLESEQYPRDYRNIITELINKNMRNEDLRDTYNLLDVSYDQFIEYMCKDYLRYKYKLLSEFWNERQNNI